MRRAAKVDANQGEIVKAFRKLGATVYPTHAVGDGFPDLVVGYRGQNILVEVKDGNRPPSERKLTKDEADFFDEWRGSAFVVQSVDCCVALLESLKVSDQG